MDATRRVVTLGEEDYDAILAVWQAAGLSIRPTGRDSREAFGAQLASGVQQVFGVRVDERLAGVVVATHDGRKGWINRLAVHPDFQRQGIALDLIEAAEQWMRDQGLHVFAALVEWPNEASEGVLAKAGYTTHPDIRYFSKRDSADA